MKTLIETVHEDMKEAMRSGDTFRRDTLRFLVSMLKNAALEKRISFSEVSDEDVFAVIRRSAKQREESIRQYRTGGREESAKKEERERLLLLEYLPPMPSEECVRETVKEAILKIGASSLNDKGKVMGYVMKLLPHASGQDVRRIVEETLQA